MPQTYTPIASTTLTAAQASVTFSSISSAYTDLVLVANAKSSLTTTTQVQLTFNSDTTTNYSWTRLLGDGSAASSARASTQSYVEVGYIAGNTGSPSPDLFTLNIQNYSNTTTFKTFLSRWGSMNAANQYVAAVVGLWRKTPEAITSITLAPNSTTFATSSTFTLYGILKAQETTMAYTYSKLASTTVGAGGTSAITFSNIPQNYTDLVVKYSIRTDVNGFRDLYIAFNSSTTSFTNRFVEGNGTSALSASTVRYLSTLGGTNTTASTFNNGEFYVPNYSGSANKSFSSDAVGENNATTTYATLAANLWSNTTAINSISLTPSNGNFVQYSTATLYGIRVEL